MSTILIAYAPPSDMAILSGGSWSVGLPLNNLKTAKLFETARSTDAATTSTKFVVDMGAAVALDCAILGPTNLTAAYTVRIKGAPTNAFASGFDTGVVASGITSTDVNPEAGVNIVNIFPSTQTFRWWSIEIDDHLNAAGYVDIGRLFLPLTLKPSINFAPSSGGLLFEDQTLRTETLSGVENNRRRRNRRTFSFTIPSIPEAEAFSSAYLFTRTAGFDQTIFLVPNPADQATMQARAFWGRIGTMDAISQVQFARAGIGYTIREVF